MLFSVISPELWWGGAWREKDHSDKNVKRRNKQRKKQKQKETKNYNYNENEKIIYTKADGIQTKLFPKVNT